MFLKELSKCRLVGEVEDVGDLLDGVFVGADQDFGFGHDGFVDEGVGGVARQPFQYEAEVLGGDEEFFGVERNFVFLFAMFQQQGQEFIHDIFLARQGGGMEIFPFAQQDISQFEGE